jgi:hypothetical protein
MAGKTPPPDPKQRRDAALVDSLLEDLYFSKTPTADKTPPPDVRAAGSPSRPGAAKRAGHVSRPGQRAVTSRRHESTPVGTWTRVGLGVVGAIGLTQWPYSHTCGFPLFGYLAGATAVLLVGAWGGVHSWRSRLPVAHLLAQAVFLVGFTVALSQVLPRTGNGSQAVAWGCSAEPEPPVAPVQTQAPPAGGPGAQAQGAVPQPGQTVTVPDSSGSR